MRPRFAQSLLRAAPDLHILATSREPLGTDGEIIWTLPPLSSPDPEKMITPESLAQYEATDLFIERALAVQPTFSLNYQNAPALAHVCACLDGIPLAIELAAARLKALSVEDVAARLDRPLPAPGWQSDLGTKATDVAGFDRLEP